MSVTGLAGSKDALLPQPLLKAATRQITNSKSLYIEAENFFEKTDMKKPPERAFLAKKYEKFYLILPEFAIWCSDEMPFLY